MSIEAQIQNKVKKSDNGTIFLTEDFANIGNINALSVALHRLVKRGVLYRLAKGIYVNPKTGKLLNKIILPSLEDIAKAIAKRDKARIIPTGSFALYSLGLSEQVPLNIVYYTDGKARKIKVENGTISFKKTSPKKLALRGRISQLVVLALSEIGKGNLTEDEEFKIQTLLQKENREDLIHDLQLAPQWIAEIMAKNL